MAKAKKPRKKEHKQKQFQHDRDKIREMFLESPFMDWTRFAEEQGWHPLQSRTEFPVKTWQEEKRRILAEKQMDILSGLIYERRFKWTHQIIETLDGYPKSIDMAKSIADAKMGQIAEMYKDYLEFRKSPGYLEQLKAGKRPSHPFEKVSITEISFLLKGMKDITEAKLKALMLDKWAITKLDLPRSDFDNHGSEEEKAISHRITVEGHGEITPEMAQGWMDEFIDKPKGLPAAKDKS